MLTEDGPLRIEVPRDREGSFEPVLIPKHDRRFTGFDGTSAPAAGPAKLPPRPSRRPPAAAPACAVTAPPAAGNARAKGSANARKVGRPSSHSVAALPHSVARPSIVQVKMTRATGACAAARRACEGGIGDVAHAEAAEGGNQRGPGRRGHRRQREAQSSGRLRSAGAEEFALRAIQRLAQALAMKGDPAQGLAVAQAGLQRPCPG